MWVYVPQPDDQAPFQKLNADNNRQKARKIRYYIFEALPNFIVSLYLGPNILSRIVDFVVRKEHKFLKSTFSRDEIRKTMRLCSLETYYNALDFLFKAYEFFSWHSDYPIHFDQYTLNE